MGLFASKEEKEEKARKKEEKARQKEEERQRIEAIEVYNINALPNRKYEALGMVYREGTFHNRFFSGEVKTGVNEMIDHLKQQTFDLGGDAVLNFTMNTNSSNDEETHWTTTVAFGTAIKYLDSED